MVQEEVTFHGHPNIQSLHAKTIEITKDEHLTLRGDCIIGVKANKACSDFSDSFKLKLKSNATVVKIEVLVGNESFSLKGMGDHRLNMLNSNDIVVRKTNFTCPRTMSIRCNKASSDIPRKIIKLLQDTNTKGILRISLD